MTAPFDVIKVRLRAQPPQRVHRPDAREAAVALILAPGAGEELELLLIERAERSGDPWSGQMALPGGRREETDDGLLDTARRETWEETGIELPPNSLLGELDDLFPNIKVLPEIVVRPFVFGLEFRPAVIPTREVAAHLWISLLELQQRRRPAEVVIRQEKRKVDAFVLGERVVWGITYRIVATLLGMKS